tara:strand:+ start:232 stop:360 length:129 start_codon:yes stop_codon:yes gene_type:complete
MPVSPEIVVYSAGDEAKRKTERERESESASERSGKEHERVRV